MAVQETVIRLHFVPGSASQQYLEFVIHFLAMSAGSMLYVSTATIYGSVNTQAGRSPLGCSSRTGRWPALRDSGFDQTVN
jgi:hypothetical protein